MRVVLQICIVFMLCSFSFAQLTIYNSEFEETQFFPLTNTDFILSSSLQNNVTLEYQISTGSNNSQIFTHEIELETCEIDEISQNYCAQKSLVEFVLSTNTSFSSAVVFTFSQLHVNKTVFLDLLPPTILSSTSVNSSSKELLVQIEVEDNTQSKINTSIEISNKDTTEELFRNSTLEEQFNISLLLKLQGEYEVKITSRDEAGNEAQEIQTIIVEDIFGPNISNISIFNTTSNTRFLRFILEDESNISNYNVRVGSFTIQEDIQEDITHKHVEFQLPSSSSDTIIITAVDGLNNSENVSIDLPSSIVISTDEYTSNIFRVETSRDAQYCLVISGFGATSSNENSHISINPTSNSRVFELNLQDLSYNVEERAYDLIIECGRDDYIQQQQKQVIVDMTPPEIYVFEVEFNLNSKAVDITFNVSSDTINSRLERDGRVISRDFNSYEITQYEDFNVEYPNSYSYQLIISDRAGNIQRSDTIIIEPLKLNVELEVITEEFEEYTRLRIHTEEGISGTISLSNLQGVDLELFNSQGLRITNSNAQTIEFESTQELVVVDIEKSNISKELEITVQDRYSNTNTQRAFITALEFTEQREELEQNIAVAQDSSIQETQIEPSLNVSLDSQASQSAVQESEFGIMRFILYFLLLLFFILVLIYVVISVLPKAYNRYEKEKAYYNLRNNEKMNTKSSSLFSTPFRKTVSLDKEIQKRIEDKKLKDQLKREEALFKKKKKEAEEFRQKTHYDQLKFKDLERRNTKPNMNFSNKYTSSFPQEDSKRSFFNIFKSGSKTSSSSGNTTQELDSNHNSEKNMVSNQTPTKQENNISQSNSKKDIFGGMSFQTSYYKTKNSSDAVEKDILNKQQTGNLVNEKITPSISPKQDTKVQTQGREEIQDTQSSSSTNVHKKEKPQIDWDSYLQKKSKSRRWFLIQKEVENEIK